MCQGVWAETVASLGQCCQHHFHEQTWPGYIQAATFTGSTLWCHSRIKFLWCLKLRLLSPQQSGISRLSSCPGLRSSNNRGPFWNLSRTPRRGDAKHAGVVVRPAEEVTAQTRDCHCLGYSHIANGWHHLFLTSDNSLLCEQIKAHVLNVCTWKMGC